MRDYVHTHTHTHARLFCIRIITSSTLVLFRVFKDRRHLVAENSSCSQIHSTCMVTVIAWLFLKSRTPNPGE